MVLRFLTDSAPSAAASHSAHGLRDFWAKRTQSGEPDVVLSPRDDVEGTLEELRSRLAARNVGGVITIDISMLLRPYIFGLIRFFRDTFPASPLRIVYSPRWMASEHARLPRLSGDIYGVSAIPLYSNLGDGIQARRVGRHAYDPPRRQRYDPPLTHPKPSVPL